MKSLLWIIVLIAAAVGLVAAALHSSAGYVQIVWPPYRVELSMVLALVVLIGAIVAVHLLMRLVSAMVGIPEWVREYRAGRRSRKAQTVLAEALREFFSGRYARAEKAASGAIKLGAQPGVAAVLAARAAHELRAYERRDDYLSQGAAALTEDDVMVVITRAELLLRERRAADALAALEVLPQKNTAGLRLELRALQQSREWEKTLPLIGQLEKRGVLDAELATDMRRHAHAAQLERRATDREGLDEAWMKVPKALKKDTIVARAAVRCYVALDAGEVARDIIERSLDAEWDGELVALYAECADSAGVEKVRQIERAERWLTAHSGDAALLLTLGRLCALQELWGKAQSYIDASIAIEATCEAHLAAAQLHEKLGNEDAAQQHYRKSLDLALMRLRADIRLQIGRGGPVAEVIPDTHPVKSSG
jgi:HemY protein